MFERYIAAPADAVALRLHQTRLAHLHGQIAAMPPRLFDLYQARRVSSVAYSDDITGSTDASVSLYFTDIGREGLPTDVVFVYATASAHTTGLCGRVRYSPPIVFPEVDARAPGALYIEFGPMHVYDVAANTIRQEFVKAVAEDVCQAIRDAVVEEDEVVCKYRPGPDMPPLECPRDVIVWAATRG